VARALACNMHAAGHQPSSALPTAARCRASAAAAAAAAGPSKQPQAPYPGAAGSPRAQPQGAAAACGGRRAYLRGVWRTPPAGGLGLAGGAGWGCAAAPQSLQRFGLACLRQAGGRAENGQPPLRIFGAAMRGSQACGQ
jgi:hypothetical protein